MFAYLGRTCEYYEYTMYDNNDNVDDDDNNNNSSNNRRCDIYGRWGACILRTTTTTSVRVGSRMLRIIINTSPMRRLISARIGKRHNERTYKLAKLI